MSPSLGTRQMFNLLWPLPLVPLRSDRSRADLARFGTFTSVYLKWGRFHTMTAQRSSLLAALRRHLRHQPAWLPPMCHAFRCSDWLWGRSNYAKRPFGLRPWKWKMNGGGSRLICELVWRWQASRSLTPSPPLIMWCCSALACVWDR